MWFVFLGRFANNTARHSGRRNTSWKEGQAGDSAAATWASSGKRPGSREREARERRRERRLSTRPKLGRCRRQRCAARCAVGGTPFQLIIHAAMTSFLPHALGPEAITAPPWLPAPTACPPGCQPRLAATRKRKAGAFYQIPRGRRGDDARRGGLGVSACRRVFLCFRAQFSVSPCRAGKQCLSPQV